MKRISFDQRFVNEAGNDLVPGKIHTIRQNYDYWKRFEGQEVALFYWDGKPYRSRQKVFCVKRILSVQRVYHGHHKGIFGIYETLKCGSPIINFQVSSLPESIAKNDGFRNKEEFRAWFKPYPLEKEMAILHFTDFRY